MKIHMGITIKGSGTHFTWKLHRLKCEHSTSLSSQVKHMPSKLPLPTWALSSKEDEDIWTVDWALLMRMPGICFSSVSLVTQSYPTLQPHGQQHARPTCPSPTPGVYSNSCPLSRWCHPTISSSVVPFSSHLQSFPASRSFPMSQFFVSGSHNIGASASVLPMNIQAWFSLGWTGWISLQSKGLSRVFSITTVQKHQFLSTQLSL